MSRFKPSSAPTLPAPRQPKPVSVASVPPAVAEVEERVDPAFDAGLHNSTRKFALNCTLAFLFFRFSFVHEFLAAKVGIDTHVLLVFGFLAYLIALLAGTVQSAFASRSTWLWLGFGAMMCLATTTSLWKGGSFAVVFPYLRTTLPFILLIPAVVFSIDDLKKVVNVIALAGITVILLGAVNADFRTGRMALGSQSGSIGDSNDYAAHILLVMPAIAYFAFSKGRNIVFKIAGAGAVGMGLFQVLSTGSRGGLVSLMVTGLYVLKGASNTVRIAILLGVPVVILAAIPFLPSESAARLHGLFESQTGKNEALESTSERTALLIESLKATASHPLLGVGPGEFMDYQGKSASEHGQHGLWHQSHNGYTQVSSECGIPAVLFYISAMLSAFFALNKGAKAESEDIRTLSRVFLIMFVSFSICLVFLSQAYGFTLLIISAVSVVITRLLKQAQPV